MLNTEKKTYIYNAYVSIIKMFPYTYKLKWRDTMKQTYSRTI